MGRIQEQTDEIRLFKNPDRFYRPLLALLKRLHELLVSLGTLCHQTTSPFSPA
jgi:hypothetical protein